jgi:hypothetical protein
MYFPIMVIQRNRAQYFREPRFRAMLRFIASIFVLTGIAWGCALANITKLQDPVMLRRSMGHTGYLMFYSVTAICIFHFLRRFEKRYWDYFLWFFIYPFLFISVWGIYQNLATYDLLPYWDGFNNSLSTGFTWFRFKHDHRISSIFPEPSEYSYYLAMMTPICWAVFRGKLPLPLGKQMRWAILILLVTQIVMIKSLSFFVALPMIALVVVRWIEHTKGVRTFLWLVSGLGILGVIAGIGFAGRLAATTAGEDGSTIARYLELLESINLFLHSPVFGFGYGIVRGMDAISFMLASFGLIGFVVLAWCLKKFINLVGQESSLVFSGALLCLITGCALSNNVLDNIFIWIILAFFAASPSVSTGVVPGVISGRGLESL